MAGRNRTNHGATVESAGVIRWFDSPHQVKNVNCASPKILQCFGVGNNYIKLWFATLPRLGCTGNGILAFISGKTSKMTLPTFEFTKMTSAI
jgi:hypothetical protein